MAPLKPVKSLYNLCVDCVLKEIKHDKKYYNFELFRKHLVSFLPGTVRSHIVDKAVSNYCKNVPELLHVIALLGDSSIKKITINRHGDHVNWAECRHLFTIIDNSDIIGLHELDIKVCSEGGSDAGLLPGLYNALSRGLASSLRVLTLHSAADNYTLKLIGAHAVHLTHLEVTCSWLIDDGGIADLLFKNSTSVISLPWPELENRQEAAIHTLSLLPTSELNRTCDTLCEVKIQDTNTSAISVILLLMFAKNLKSFGGFLYDRNIGDTVLSVQSRENAPDNLALTELWDMDLPSEKLENLLRSLPKLSHLYTRTVCLPDMPDVIPTLTHLTADFDFVHYGYQFFSFLDHYGRSIRKLVLIDQVYGLDLGSIANACPQLEELTAKVYVENTLDKYCSLLSKLRYAEIRITSPRTFSWLMKQADNIKHLEVLLEHERGLNELFDNLIITQLIEDNPKSLRSITQLGIHLLWRTLLDGLAFSCGMLHIEAAYALCSACTSLRVLGELDTWLQVSRKDVLNMAEHIKKSNWDIKLRYKHKLYPDIT